MPFSPFLIGSTCLVVFAASLYFFRYAVRQKHLKLLYLMYCVATVYTILMNMAFDFNKMVFDVGKLASYLDLPTFMTNLISIFILSKFCFKDSIFKTMSKTLDKDNQELYPWLNYILFALATSFIFSCISLINFHDNPNFANLKIFFLLIGLIPCFIFVLFLFPMVLIQVAKQNKVFSA